VFGRGSGLDLTNRPLIDRSVLSLTCFHLLPSEQK
jgi:hypothetical protein